MGMANAVAPPRDPTAVLGRRIAAYLIDVTLVVVIGAALVATAVTRVYGAPAGTCPGFIATAGTYWCRQIGGHLYVLNQSARLRSEAITMLAGFLDLVVLQAFTGASVGKHCFGLRVVDQNGDGPSFLRTLARWIMLVVDSGCFLVGLITVSVTHPHRRVGDLVCDTYVVSRSDAGHPIVGVRYRVPRTGAQVAPAGPPPHTAVRRPSPPLTTNGATTAPVPGGPRSFRTKRAAKAASNPPPKPAPKPAPKPVPKPSAQAGSLPGNAAVQWAEPPTKAPNAPGPKPAPMSPVPPVPKSKTPTAPASARPPQKQRSSKSQQPRWSPVASLPPPRAPVEYLEPGPGERREGR